MNGSGWFKFGAIALAMAFFCLFFRGIACDAGNRTHSRSADEAAGRSFRRRSAPEQRSSGRGEEVGAACAREVGAGEENGREEDEACSESASGAAADTGINRVGNKAGELLQIIAYHGIRAIVSLFEAMLK